MNTAVYLKPLPLLPNGEASNAEPRVPRTVSPEVRAWKEEITLPTYLAITPDKNPMFLEKRVYQGSSGKVYPLPFTDRIAEQPVDRKWRALWIENEFIRVLVLPEIGGRIHAIQDKTNGSSSPPWSGWPGRGRAAALNSTGRSITVPRRFCRWILKSKPTRMARPRSGAATMTRCAA